MIKTLEALISVKFIKTENKIFQHFIIEKKKGVSKYIFDKRFNVYDVFEDKVKTYSLSYLDDDFIFTDRKDEEDRIVLEFSFKDKDFKKPKNYFFIIPGFVPPSASCQYCKYYDENDDGISYYCNVKKKIYTHKVKNCHFFKQRDDLFKT